MSEPDAGRAVTVPQPKEPNWFRFSLLELILVSASLSVAIHFVLKFKDPRPIQLFAILCPLNCAGMLYSLHARKCDNFARGVCLLLSPWMIPVGIIFGVGCRCKTRMRLIELMTVVAIVAIIAAIAIPNLMRTRMAAMESAAIMACRTYVKAQDAYFQDMRKNGKTPQFAPDLKTLGVDNWIDRAMVKADGTNAKPEPKAGYIFKILDQGYVESNSGWTKRSYTNASGEMVNGHAIIAWYVAWDDVPRPYFIVDQSGVIYSKIFLYSDKTTFESFDTFDPRGWTKVDDE